MQLTPHFTLAELTASQKAKALAIDNIPDDTAIANLRKTAAMLEHVRELLGVPVTVTSGYRSPRLNRAVGGVTSSDHTKGMAADIVAPKFGTPEQIARKLADQLNTLNVGQLILEGVKGKQWVHVSTEMPTRPVNRVLTITDSGARTGIRSLT